VLLIALEEVAAAVAAAVATLPAGPVAILAIVSCI